MTAPAPGAAAPDDDRRWWLLFTVMVGTMASIMSSTIVNVAVPDMSRAFALGPARAQWMAAGFMAAMTVSMLVTPWLLDRFGLRRTYTGVTLLLLAGGLGGGFGRSVEWVLAMRVAEGLAAGVMQPIPAIVVMRRFAAHEQGKAMGVFGMGAVLAPAVGPSIGGVLVEHFGWRSIFFVVVPFCLAALVMTARFVPRRSPQPTLPARLDGVGLLLVAVGLVALLNAMVGWRSAGGLSPGVLGLMVLALAAGAAFLVQQRRTTAPLVDPALFTHLPLRMGGIVAFVYGMALFGSTYLVPVFMQDGLKLPPSQAGAVLFPAGIALAITIPWAGRLCDRFPLHRLLVGGVLLLAASFALMPTVGVGGSLALVALWAVVGRVGLGFVLPSLNIGAVRPLAPSQIAQGASVVNFLRQLGGAVGISLTGIVLEWRLAAHPGADAIAAFHEAFVLLAIVTAAAALAAWRMRPGAAPTGS